MLYVFLIDFSVVFGIWGLKFVSCGWSELGFFFLVRVVCVLVNL